MILKLNDQTFAVDRNLLGAAIAVAAYPTERALDEGHSYTSGVRKELLVELRRALVESGVELGPIHDSLRGKS